MQDPELAQAAQRLALAIAAGEGSTDGESPDATPA